ncbi:MAG: hypothetical protein ACM37Z_13045 [Deltaproteobacteria bacterium]
MEVARARIIVITTTAAPVFFVTLTLQAAEKVRVALSLVKG